MLVSHRQKLKNKILMETAFLWAEASYSERLQVGCVIARDNRILCTGYNGTLPDTANVCEDDGGTTLETVVHAEENAILYCARKGISVEGAVIYVTDSPCVRCAKMIISAKISAVFFNRPYRDSAPLNLLRENGVKVQFQNRLKGEENG